ncbi:metalloproteinase inhibitor 3-like [Mytilus trossulus]|uniref:metalloproteinase inhibitor 3-like n=1 Tax=Mytilus trossulus TaxID=6551 RepID=UPI0030042517
MGYIRILIVVTIIISLAGLALSGCRCQIKHPQTAFCTHNYVIKVMVKAIKENLAENGYKQYLSKNYNPDTVLYRRTPKKIILSRTYKIKILRIYKNSKKFKQANIKLVMTPGSYKSCGVILKKKRVYILAGDVINTELWIDGCSWVQEFKSLTKQNLNGLNKKYRQNCNCQIKHCTGRNCRNHSKNCEFRHEIWGCYRDYGICDHRPHSDNCHWKQNQDFNKCIKQSNRKLRRNKRKRKRKN